MEYDLKFSITLSKEVDLEDIEEEIKKLGNFEVKELKQLDNKIFIEIKSEERRAHEWALRIHKKLAMLLGKRRVGVREMKLNEYTIKIKLDKKPLKSVSIPFADVEFKDDIAIMKIVDKEEEFMRRNYVDRMIRLLKEKIEKQYYEGKKE